MDPKLLLQPMEETKEAFKVALRAKGLVSDDQMKPTANERQKCSEFSDYLLGICKTLEYLSGLQRDAFAIPNSPSPVEIALVEEIDSVKQRLRHMLPPDLRKTKAQDIELQGSHEVVVKCYLATLLELETAMLRKFNEIKAEEKAKAVREKRQAKNKRRKEKASLQSACLD